MKVFLSVLILACVAGSLAQFIAGPSYQFTGQFDRQPAALEPYVGDGSCSFDSGSNLYKYANFTITFNTAGVRRMSLFEANSGIQVFSYQSSFFVPTNTCFVQPVEYNGDGFEEQGPFDFDFAAYFEATAYTFVLFSDLSSTDTSTGNIFAGEIYDGFFAGSAATSGSATWSPVQNVNQATCTASSSVVQYAYLTFTAPSTGLFDVGAYFASNVSFDESALAVYTGAFDSGISTSGCTANLLQASYSDQDGQWLFGLSFTSGSTYTAVVSVDGGGSDQGGNPVFDLAITPSLYVSFHTVLTYTEPTRGSNYFPSCTATSDDSRTNIPYAAASLNVTAGDYFWITIPDADGDSAIQSNDLYFFTYSGSNVGTSVSSPFTCLPAIYFDSNDALNKPYYATRDTFSVVASPYHGTDEPVDSTFFLIVFLINGPSITAITPPAGAATTFSAASATTGPASGPTATGPAGPSTATGPTTAGPTAGPATVASGSSTSTTSAHSLSTSQVAVTTSGVAVTTTAHHSVTTATATGGVNVAPMVSASVFVLLAAAILSIAF